MVMLILKMLLVIVIAYLLGSIPTGYLIVKKLKGIDIRQTGSGSTGATNVKRIMGTNLVINQAMETIKFDMNNKGVKVKSEAAMTVMTTALAPEEEARMFAFDDTFVIFLKEKGKNSPYLALRVNDIEKFQK